MEPLPGGEPDGEEGKNMNKEQATALASEGKKKATAFWTAFKEKIVALWKSGRKGKAICIGGAVVVLLLLTRCGGGSVDTGRGGEFTGKNFDSVFMGVNTDDEGVIYAFSSSISIKVLQATKNGNLVGYIQGANPFLGGVESFVQSLGGSFDRIVWVETPGKRYEDGETLGDGYYIRRGSYEYKGIDGGEHTVARYVEVTDKATLQKIQKQIEDEAAAEAQAKLEAEGKPFEVDAPVKSLCGFSIGATPSSVKALFTNPSEDEKSISGNLVTPFRYFDFAELEFSPLPVSGGKHLSRVVLRVRPQLETSEEFSEEIKTIVGMLEKKFGIKFVKTSESRYNSLSECSLWYKWKSEGGDDSIKQSIDVFFQGRNMGLWFNSDLLSANEGKALKEKQKPAKLSSDAGSDQL